MAGMDSFGGLNPETPPKCAHALSLYETVKRSN